MNEPIDFKNMSEEELKLMCSEKEATMEELQEMTLQLLRANDELREADASKQKFMSLIKNEFNNPMSALLNLSKRLADNKHIDSSKDIGTLMHTELLRMDFQLRNIFAMTELESGLISNDYSKVNVKQMIDDAKEEFIYTIENKKIRFDIKIDKEIILVTDGDKLFLILLNFISNACEFSKDRSSVTISLFKENEKIVLSVADDGSELPKLEDMDAIFNTFSSYNQDAARSFSGLGIGLSVARSMADQLGSSIRYESGNGKTIFAVVLPQRELKNGEESFGSGEVFFDNFLGDDDDAVEF